MNCVLKREVVIDRDLIFVTEPIWKYLVSRYRGEEIRRYAIPRNLSGILDRSPILPLVLFTIVIRDEPIRTPKYLVLPRKSRLGHIKQQLKDQYMWLREYPLTEIRLWRLKPDSQDSDFIDQYNHFFNQGQLPDILKFPGFCLEKSLDFYIEEYGTMDMTRQSVFIEVHRRGTPWIFQLEADDPSQFDAGATDLTQHRKIYQDSGEQLYAQWYKYFNSTSVEYYEHSASQLYTQ